MADHTQIVSSTARRTRIRLSRKRRNPKEIARIAEALKAFPDVSGVQTNLTAGTIVVYHDKEVLNKIEATLEDLGVIVMAAASGEPSAKSLTDAVSDLDKLFGLSRAGIDLKLLVPLGFGAFAALQLVRRGLEIGGRPGTCLPTSRMNPTSG